MAVADLVFLAVIVAFFTVATLYVRACGALADGGGGGRGGGEETIDEEVAG